MVDPDDIPSATGPEGPAGNACPSGRGQNDPPDASGGSRPGEPQDAPVAARTSASPPGTTLLEPPTDDGEAPAGGPIHDGGETPRAAEHDSPAGLAAIEQELAAEAEAQAEDLEESSIPGPWQGTLPETLLRILSMRVSVWRRLLELDAQRQQLGPAAFAREIRDELARQSRELQKIPPVPAMQETLKRLTARMASPVLRDAVPAVDPRTRQPIPDQHRLYEQVLTTGVIQTNLLLKRAGLDAFIPPAALPAAQDEPLLQLCRAHGLDADRLIGWTYYALGLGQYIGDARQRLQEQRAAAVAEPKPARGFLGVFGGTSVGSATPPDGRIELDLQAARRELQVIEPQLTELFWELYEAAAWLHAQDRATPAEAPVLRAFLRYGLVCRHPGLIPPESLAWILRDCTEDVRTRDLHPGSTHVLYADEYIADIVRGRIPVSPDEDLDLNGRGTPEWRADRTWRQAVVASSRCRIIEARLRELQAAVEAQEKQAATRQELIETLKFNPRARGLLAEVLQECGLLRANIARLRNGAETIEQRVLPKVHQQAEEAQARLVEQARVLTPEQVARREARFIRRMARLTARLKEPFPPFVLREHLVPGRGDHHHRAAVLEALRQLEEADQRVFHMILVHNKRMERQITVRVSPTFLITPGRGQMGLSVSQRKWDDDGRFALPLLCQRQGLLESLLIDMLADFRWDCSREEAGMDWLMADALCAGYAAVRWNIRKLSEKAQKAMGFDPRLKDRPNWRYHYRLFVTSAREQGRLLFTKCNEVYKIVLKYIGLPPGVQPLKRD